MPLSARQRSCVDNADGGAIRAALASVRGNWPTGNWLAPTNRYKVDCIGRLKADLAPGKTITHSHMREYIAASAIIHCLDGWSFLGRAIEAEMRGDPGASCHLAYYAELRAAMSILAAEGIGVLNQQHAVVDSRKRCDCFRAAGTHQFAWDVLKYWATKPASTSLLFSVIEPGDVPLEEWLTRFSVGAGFQSTLGGSWLKQWGLDLARLSEDRDARNIASYRPTAFTSAGATSASDTMDAMQEIWSLCEPVGDRQFAIMDRHLLRQSLALTFKESSGLSHKQAPKQYALRVKNMLHAITAKDLSSDSWYDFLTYKLSPDTPQFFLDAEGSSRALDHRHSKQVLARASLLLRVSTGASGKLLGSLTGMTSSELQFWWSPLGEDRGLWESGNEPDSFFDLWADIRDALQDLELWRNAAGGDPAYSAMWSSSPGAAAVLGSMERTALWGLGL